MKGKMMYTIIVCTLYLILCLSGMTLIKFGAGQKTGITIWKFHIPYLMMLGILFYGLSFLLFSFVMSKMQISMIIPITAAIHTCSVALIGVIIFNEVLTRIQIIGILVVIIGSLLIGLGK